MSISSRIYIWSLIIPIILSYFYLNNDSEDIKDSDIWTGIVSLLISVFGLILYITTWFSRSIFSWFIPSLRMIISVLAVYINYSQANKIPIAFSFDDPEKLFQNLTKLSTWIPILHYALAAQFAFKTIIILILGHPQLIKFKFKRFMQNMRFKRLLRRNR